MNKMYLIHDLLYPIFSIKILKFLIYKNNFVEIIDFYNFYSISNLFYLVIFSI